MSRMSVTLLWMTAVPNRPELRPPGRKVYASATMSRMRSTTRPMLRPCEVYTTTCRLVLSPTSVP